MRNRAPILLLLLAVALPARGQYLPDSLSADARISLVTITPGDAVYSMYGHSAFRVTDPETGYDLVFNYGTFDFSQPWFIPRFAYGRLEYYLSVTSVSNALRLADLEGRTVTEQVLDLHAPERDSLYAFLLFNLRPENRTYRYDFFFDNCATRIRDVLEDRLGAAVVWTADPGGGRTLRELLQPYAEGRPWLGAGIDLALGAATDRPATPRESAFLPLLLEELVATAMIGTEADTRPLAGPIDTLLVPSAAPPAPSGTPWPLLLGGLVFAWVGLVTWRERRRHRTLRPIEPVDRILFGLAGLAGIVLAFLVFISEHAVTSPNWNLLWASPTHLLIALLPGRVPRHAVTVYYALSAVSGIAVLAAPLVLPQTLPAVTMPLAAALVLRSVRGAFAARERQPFQW